MKCFSIQYTKNNEEQSLNVSCALICAYHSKDYDTTQEKAIKEAVASIVGCNWNEITQVVNLSLNENNDTFIVNEHMNGFSLTHLPSNKNHWLSDGVDVLTYPLNDDEITLHPGTLGFVETWTDTFNQSVGETLEAYFPDIDE